MSRGVAGARVLLGGRSRARLEVADDEVGYVRRVRGDAGDRAGAPARTWIWSWLQCWPLPLRTPKARAASGRATAACASLRQRSCSTCLGSGGRARRRRTYAPHRVRPVAHPLVLAASVSRGRLRMPARRPSRHSHTAGRACSRRRAMRGWGVRACGWSVLLSALAAGRVVCAARHCVVPLVARECSSRDAACLLGPG